MQAGRQRHPADRLVVLILLPATAGQVTPYYGLHRQGLEPLDQHGAPRHLRRFSRRDHALRRLARQVDRANGQTLGAEFVEPKQGHLRQQHALARNRLAHDDIKSA